MRTTADHIRPDQELVKEILSGNRLAFRELVQNTTPLVAQIVNRLVDDAEDRKDMMQDIYTNVYTGLRNYRFESKLSTWVARIAFNASSRHLEKKKSVKGSLIVFADHENVHLAGDEGPGSEWGSADLDDPAKILGKKQRASILADCIAELPPLYRTLVTLFHNEQQSYEEMAIITDLPEGTVKSYLFRARSMMKKNLLNKYKKEEL